MIQHIALFQWKAGASELAIVDAIGELGRLKAIPSLSSFAVGSNFSKFGKGYSYALVCQFANREALKAYWPDPLHQEVVAAVESVVDNVLIIDFDTGLAEATIEVLDGQTSKPESTP